MSATTTATPPQGDVTAQRRTVTSHALEFVEKYGLVLLLILLFVVFASVWNRPATFRSISNIRAVVGTYSVPAIVALAAIVPLICGQFDLTVGPVAGLTALATAGALTKSHSSLVVAIVIALMLGLLVGVINGYLVAYVKVNAFITTLGMSSLITGFLALYSGGNSILISNSTLSNLGSLNWLGIPRLCFFAIAAAAIMYYLLEHTPFGRYLHSVGSNPVAARLVGLDVDRLTFLSFVLSSLLASVAGILLLATNGSADQALGGLPLTLPALAAAFLGATTIKPGQFNVLGTMVAVLFVAFSLSGLNLNGVASWVTDVFTGATLVLAVAISTLVGRQRARTG